MQKKPVGPCLLITPWNFPLATDGVVVPGDDLDVVGQVRVQPKRGHVQLQGVGARRQGFFDLLVAVAAVGLQVKGAVAPVGLDRVGV
jgi:hypothetical protein